MIRKKSKRKKHQIRGKDASKKKLTEREGPGQNEEGKKETISNGKTATVMC